MTKIALKTKRRSPTSRTPYARRQEPEMIKIIDEVKNHGYFTYEGTDEKVDATLSADDNFLLIYQDSSTEKKNENKKADAEKFFKEYKAK